MYFWLVVSLISVFVFGLGLGINLQAKYNARLMANNSIIKIGDLTYFIFNQKQLEEFSENCIKINNHKEKKEQ